MTPLVNHEHDGRVVTLTLNDPDRRNALGDAMFDALIERANDLHQREDVTVVVLRGAGPAFCAGFDLAAAVASPPAMAGFIDRLSHLNRTLRRMPQVVIAAAHGAAIAGGCAMLSACDMVAVGRTTSLGYPVHRIGVSPAVTLPTLLPAIGPGAARALVMSGAIISGEEAHRIGLATHLADDDDRVPEVTMTLADRIAAHGPVALRATKAWINELDGSDADSAFDATAKGTAALATEDEAITMLARMWAGRKRG